MKKLYTFTGAVFAVALGLACTVSTKVMAEETQAETVSTTQAVEETTTTPEETTTVATMETTPAETTQKIVKGYVVSKTGKGLKCLYSGKAQKKVYLTIVKKKNKYTVVKPGKKGAGVYYFDKKGNGKQYQKTGFVSIKYKKQSKKYYVKAGKIGTGWYKKSGKKYYYTKGKMVTGWKKIKGKKYYFSKSKAQKGQMQKDTIVGNEYVDSTGVMVTSSDIRLAVKYVNAHTQKSWSKSQKLRACYLYLCSKSNFSYQRFYGQPTASSLPGYATYMFTYHRGNCFRYATTFAYIAKVLGYDSKVCVGMISSIHGGMTPHGWTEVQSGGTWYMCDADMQSESGGVDSYMKTNATYRYRHSCSRKYTITIRNGKVAWK